jgi:hypothetical protein
VGANDYNDYFLWTLNPAIAVQIRARPYHFGRWRVFPVPLMRGIVSIARYVFNWCKRPQAWHVASKMQLSYERLPI